MAEQTTGIKYSISIDDSELRKAAERIEGTFEEISSDAVSSGNKMDSIFDKAAASASGAVDDFASLTEQIKFQKDIIAGLEKDLKVLEDAYKNAAPGKEWADAVAKFNSIKAELNGEKKALEEMEAQAKETAGSQVSMRTRMREVREELIALEAAGQRGTAEYRKLQEEAGKLQDAYSDAAAQMRIMANDQRGMQGIISGLTGVSAAFSAASGVVGLFTKDNEKLQQAMLRVQSLMSITVGLQQIQQTLNKDSAFRLVIINGLKDYWTRATQKATAAMVAEAAATKAAGAAAATSAGFFRTLGVALKSLSAGAITAILAALTAIAIIVAKLIKGEKQISGEMKRQKEYINGVREARVEAQKATLKEVIAMDQSVARLRTLKNGTKEYERTVKDIADKLGVQYNWLVKNTEKVESLAAAWRDVKIAQAMGDAYLNKAANVKTDALDAVTKLQNINKSEDARDILGALGFVDKKFIDNYIKLVHNFRKSGGAAYGTTKEQVWRQIKSMESQLLQLADAQADRYVKEFNKEVDKQAKAMAPITAAQDEANRQKAREDAAKKAREQKEAEYEAAKKAVENGEKELEDFKTNLENKAAEYDIMLERDATQRKIKEIDEREKKELDALTEFGNKVLEKEREVAKARAAMSGEEYVEENVTLPEGFKQMLDKMKADIEENARRQRKTVTEEAKKAYDELAAEYADLQGKIAAIKAKYEKQLETAGDDEELKAKIYAAQKNEIASLILESFKAEDSIGKVAEQVQNLGKAARSALLKNLQKIADFVTTTKKNGGLSEQTKESVEAFAALNNISRETLEALIANDGALEAFLGLIEKISKETTEPIDNISKAIKNYKKALKELKESDNPINVENLEQAQAILEGMTKQLADNMLDAADAIARMFSEIADMTGNDKLAKVGNALSDIVGNIQAAEAGAQAWGGWWGAIIGGLTDLIPKIIKWINMGNEESLEYLERELSILEQELDYWTKITEAGGRWIAPDFRGWFEQLKNLYDEYNELNKLWKKDSGKSMSEKELERYKELAKQISQMEQDMKNFNIPLPSSEEAYQRAIENYGKQIEDLWAKAEALRAKYNRNSEKWGAEYMAALDAVAEKMQERADYIREQLEEALGVSASSLASQISDALVSAFESGSDAAKSFGDTVADVMKTVVKNIVITRVIEEKLNEMFNEIENINWKGEDPDMAKANYIFSWLHDNLEPMIENMGAAWDRAAERWGWSTSETTAQGKGIATASQDTVDELNGRMTVVQANTTELLENSALNLQYTSSILSVVTHIKSDTSAMRDDLAMIHNDVSYIRNYGLQ